jgi:small-conductance mechanosensitive channel
LAEPAPEVLVNAVRPDHMVFRLRFWVVDYSKGDAVASAVIEQAYANLERMHAVPAVVATP